ncbi:MAG TPA: hypothetical protein VHK91_17300 [Flavisolibacter sp.]|jgi:hypothetical protein|nr:hypothetical protein [Flavisolibacter sp.]
MARIFNIYFNYDNADFHAVVSVRTTSFFTEYTLNNLDDRLLEQLPGTKILSTGAGEFNFQHVSPVHNNALMKEVIRAVAEHLKTTIV